MKVINDVYGYVVDVEYTEGQVFPFCVRVSKDDFVRTFNSASVEHVAFQVNCTIVMLEQNKDNFVPMRLLSDTEIMRLDVKSKIELSKWIDIGE